MSYSLQPSDPQPPRLLCPWDSPGKNTGEGCHALLQGLFLTQGLNPHLLHLLYGQEFFLPLVTPGKPIELFNWSLLTDQNRSLLIDINLGIFTFGPFLLLLLYGSIHVKFQDKQH